MITGMNESKILTKHISYKYKLNFLEENIIQTNDGIMINVDLSVKNIMYVKNTIFGTPVQVVVKIKNI